MPGSNSNPSLLLLFCGWEGNGGQIYRVEKTNFRFTAAIFPTGRSVAIRHHRCVLRGKITPTCPFWSDPPGYMHTTITRRAPAAIAGVVVRPERLRQPITQNIRDDHKQTKKAVTQPSVQIKSGAAGLYDTPACTYMYVQQQ